MSFEHKNKYSDIRVIKRDLRAKYRGIRENMDKNLKVEYDKQIVQRFLSSKVYKNAKCLFCFVSTDIEVNTRPILLQAFADKKAVAVPKCLDKDGNMSFYFIESLDELRPSFFNLLEPDIQVAKEAIGYSNAVCVLPGFAFDTKGYRIGFGKGYYDRFLKSFKGVKVGICYNSCITNDLPHGRYDEPADFIVTQRYTVTTNNKKVEAKYSERRK